MALGRITVRVVSSGAGVPNQPLQVILASGSFQHIYQDAAGTQLISASGYVSSDANGWLNVYAQDGVEYHIRVLNAGGSIIQVQEGIFPQTPLSSTPHVELSLVNILTANQTALSPTGIAAALPNGSLVLPNGNIYQDPNSRIDLKLNGAVVGAVHTLNISSPYATAFTTGSGATAEGTVTFAVPTASITTQEEGTNVASSISTLNFTGAGATVSAVGTVVSVNVPGNPLAVKDEDILLTPNATSMNFRGAGVTATTIGGDTTVTISGNALQVKDEGVSLTGNTASLNFVGDGVHATQVGNDVTVTANRTPLVTGKNAVDHTTDTRRLNFQGAGVTVTGVAGEAQINIPATTVSAYNGATALAAAVTKITVIGGGVSFTSPATGEVVLDIPASLNEAIVNTTTGLNITAAHHGQRVVVTAGTTQPIIVDANLPANFRCRIVQAGAGRVVVGAGPGVIVNSAEGTYSTDGLGSVLDLVQTNSNVYALTGDLQPLHTEVWSVNGFSGNVLLDVNHVPGAVARVNGFAPDANGNVSIDGSALAGVVRSVNGAAPNLLGDVQVPIVTNGAAGLMTPLQLAKLDAVPLDLTDFIQDAAAAMIVGGAHTGVTAAYNDALGTLSLAIPAAAGTNLTSASTAAAVQITSSTGSGAVIAAATPASAGVMTALDKLKLDGIPAVLTTYTDEQAQDAAAAMLLSGAHLGASVSYNDALNSLSIQVAPTDLSVATTATTNILVSSTGIDAVLQPASVTAAGLMTSADRLALAALTTGVGGVAVALTSVPTATSVAVNPGVGTGATIAAATPLLAGVMSAADKIALDAVTAAGAAVFSAEMSQDATAELFINGVHPNLSIVYNDPPNTINVAVVGTNLDLTQTPTQADFSIVTGAGVSLLQATNLVAGLLTAVDKVKLDALPNDANEFAEAVEDSVAAILLRSAHSGLTVAYSDVTGQLNLTSTGSGSGSSYTDEMAQDATAALIAAGTHTGITATYNDAAGSLSFAVTGGAGSTANLSLGTATATTQPVANSNGTGFTLPSATATAAGLMSAADRIKVEASAGFLTALSKEAAEPWMMAVGAISYVGSAPSGYGVVWADGGTGQYTTTSYNVINPNLIDGYTITYVAPVTVPAHPFGNKMVTQPTMTRDSSGKITNRPARTVV